MLDRRAFVCAAGAFAAWPAAAAAGRDAAFLALLDGVLQELKDRPAEAAVARLDAFDPSGLSPMRRWEHAAVREGLAAEATQDRTPTYAGALSLAFGGPVDPKTAHARALAAARRLQARADDLLRRQGLSRGTVAERLRQLAGDERYLYPDSEAGRERAAAEMNVRLAALRPRLSTAFGDLPLPQAEVRRMSTQDEAAGRGGYRTADAYYVDLKAIRARPAWTLPSVAFHETVPGHLLQGALQEAVRPHPLRLRYAGAFSEAWATYAEQLAGDLGAYAGDPLGELGALQWRLFRIARIVADTGLGALGWSPEAAMAAMRDLQGQSIAFITIEADVGRMVRTPGAAAAQGLGALAIARLRPAQRDRWPAFHAAILSGGPWPFGLLQSIGASARPFR